jgi:hypothetical protein
VTKRAARPPVPDAQLCHRLAANVLSNELILNKYWEVLEKGRRLNVEFVKGAWPDFNADQEKLMDVTRYIVSLEPALTPQEISKVYDIVRSSLGR